MARPQTPLPGGTFTLRYRAEIVRSRALTAPCSDDRDRYDRPADIPYVYTGYGQFLELRDVTVDVETLDDLLPVINRHPAVIGYSAGNLFLPIESATDKDGNYV